MREGNRVLIPWHGARNAKENEMKIENINGDVIITVDGDTLQGANLWGANLAGANLAEANLWGANLAGANLAEANLWEIGRAHV